MNVLKPNLKATVETLLAKGISQREINRKTGINRKTIRRYARLYHEGCRMPLLPAIQTTPLEKRWPPALGSNPGKIPHPGHRLWRKTCRSTPVPRVSLIGSGLKNN